MGKTSSVAKSAGTGTASASGRGHVGTGHQCDRCGNAPDPNGNRAARRLAKKKGIKAKPPTSNES